MGSHLRIGHTGASQLHTIIDPHQHDTHSNDNDRQNTFMLLLV